VSRPPSSSGPNWPALGIVVIALASLLMLSRLIGCSGNNQNAAIPSATDHGDPAEFLQRMVDKYQQAASYGDHGVLTLNVVRSGKPAQPQSWPFAVQFVRPGRLRIDSYNLHLASDATAAEPLLIAQVDDVESNNIDHQVVVRPAPPEAKFSALSADPILFAHLVSRTGRPPAPLELLLDQRPLATLLGKDAKLVWLADAAVEGRNCYRIEYTAEEGKYVFWIDAEELLLRRLEYPASLLPDLAGDKAVNEAHLVAELADATFSPKAEELAFTLPIPPDAKRMRAFVMPVIALDAKLIGQPVRTFELTQVDGEKITPAKVKGKITALFWYAHHPLCEQPARQFAEAAKTLGDDQQAFAVCTELADVGDKAVRDQLAAWKVDLPPVRDLKQYHERVFQVRELPSITLLDAEGRFQWMGSGETAAAEFPEALARLASGENLAAEALRREWLAREEYQRLVAAGGPQLDTGLAAASSPKRLKLTRKWKIDKLTAGGIVIAAADRLLVVAGPRSVWELDADGQVAKKHDLPLPEKVEITSLRTFQAAEGKTIHAVFTPLQAGVHVLDDDWKLLFSYPAGDDDSPPVRDVQLADLDENGEPELLVAFDGNVGLHSVSMSGERLWSNRAYTPLVSLALSHELPVIKYCAYVTGRGGILPINKDGIEGLPKEVPGWVVAHLFCSRFSNAEQTAYAAIAADAKGELCLVGLDKVLEEKWNYPLPGGTFQRPVDFLTSGKLRTDSHGEWIVAWSDGSIHIVSEDGQFDDTFNTGAEIRGIAVMEREGKPLLVVSTPKEVLAWEVH
jgi:hypothetical protein